MYFARADKTPTPGIVNGWVAGDSQDNVKIGYVVPVPDDYVTNLRTPGLNEYFYLLDGYYNPGSGSAIPTYGWNGTGGRYIKGYESGAICQLKTSGRRNHEWNGHYTGTAAFWADQSSGWAASHDPGGNPNVHANTTHLVLSQDAGRYIANNFGIHATGLSGTVSQVGYPFRTTINIVGGSGAGQVGFVNAVSRSSGNYVVIEWRGNDAGDTVGISSARPLDDTSVYSINMDPCGVNRTHFPTMSQFGGIEYASNKYGEQFSVLHIPNNSRIKFLAGEKLVELKDRASDTPWLVTSYASRPYHAEGAEGNASLDLTPATRAIEEIRNAARRLAQESSDPFALQFIPATSGGLDGKLAVCTHVTIENVGDPADATWTNNRGPEIFGSVGYVPDAGGT